MMKAKKLLNLLEHTSVFSKAVSLGYPYAVGYGKPKDGVWMSKFTKRPDGSGPVVYVGYDHRTKKFVVEYEDPEKEEGHDEGLLESYKC